MLFTSYFPSSRVIAVLRIFCEVSPMRRCRTSFPCVIGSRFPNSRSFTLQSGILSVAVHNRRPVLVPGAPTFGETVGRCEIGVLVEPDDGAALEQRVREIQDRGRMDHQFEFEQYS